MRSTINKILVVLAAILSSVTVAKAQIVTTKDITNNYNGTYTITMSAYATGAESLVVTTDKKPVDAVLVLDLSGSMNNTIRTTNPAYIPSTYTLYGISLDNGLKNSSSYYIYWSDAQYYQVTVTTSSGTTTATFTAGGVTYGMQWDGSSFSVPSGCTDVPIGFRRVVLHQKVSKDITRMQALKEAVTIFINNLKEDQMQWNADHDSNTISHRVSLVTFNNEAKTIVELTNGDVVDNYDNLILKTINVSSVSVTRADLGMKNALAQIQNKRDDANLLTVFFTDGTPTLDSDYYNSTVASNAVSYSHSIKEKGATVYSLSVIQWDSNSNEDKFLNYLSSNYPNSTSMSSPGSKTSSSYYTVANDQSELSKAFAEISTTAIVGGSSVTYESNAYLQDVMSDYFIINDINNYGVYTEDFKEIDASGNYIFGNRTDASGIGTVIYGGGIRVKGFNYSYYYCGYRIKKDDLGNPVTDSSGNPVTEAGGKRLVVVVNKVVPKLDADGTGYVPTNDDSKSGVFASDSTMIARFTSNPSKVYTNADLTVKISGLAEGESVIFKITSNVPVNMNATKAEIFERTIVLTGVSGGGAVQEVIKAPVKYLDSDGNEQSVIYSVIPETWAWTYDVSPSSMAKPLYKEEDGTLDNVFEFTAGTKSGTVNSDEDAKENVFQTQGDTTDYGFGFW